MSLSLVEGDSYVMRTDNIAVCPLGGSVWAVQSGPQPVQRNWAFESYPLMGPDVYTYIRCPLSNAPQKR